MDAELDLLDSVRFTETFEQLDTLTVTSDLVREPESFIQLCSKISTGTFMRFTPEISLIDPDSGRLSSKFPFYFNS